MLDKVGIIVQARMSSSRFPGKSLKEIGGEPLIHYVVNRLELLGLPVIICTSDQSSDDPLVEYLKSSNTLYYRGDLENVLDRYIRTAEEFDIERIIRVTGDNPLVDIDLLSESLPLFNSFDYVDGIYSGGLIKGIGFEFVLLSELKKIPAASRSHLEHVTSWLRENLRESERRVQLIPDKHQKYRNDIILTCDYPEDLELLENIFKYFNYRSDLKTREIVNYLDEFPVLKEINRSRHQE